MKIEEQLELLRKVDELTAELKKIGDVCGMSERDHNELANIALRSKRKITKDLNKKLKEQVK